MRTGLSALAFKGEDAEQEMAGATLWKDSETEELSVEIDTPWDGLISSKEIGKLIKFLETAKKLMESIDQ